MNDQPNPWRQVDSNPDLILWEAPLPKGGALRVATPTRPPDWLVQHHYARYGEHPPEVELGARGQRLRLPGSHEWHEYEFVPRR